MQKFKITLSFLSLLIVFSSCSKLKDITSSDRLYFCEKYISSTDKCEGESTKYTTGTLTVMIKLSKPIGVSEVDINITDLSSGKAVDTYPFTTPSTEDYIYFDGVDFKEPGKYRVSCLKKDGTVIVSNEIEIVSK
jgi:hypothetical protein